MVSCPLLFGESNLKEVKDQLTTDNGQRTTIKESSDELNPPVAVADAAVPSARAARSAKDYLALAIATCGVGYIPLAPGTWGSIVGIALYLLIQSYAIEVVNHSFAADSFARFLPLPIIVAVELVSISIIILLGIWAASRTEQLSGKKDPGKVVIDEVAGQMIALLPLVPGADPGWISILIAFVLFRISILLSRIQRVGWSAWNPG